VPEPPAEAVEGEEAPEAADAEADAKAAREGEAQPEAEAAPAETAPEAASEEPPAKETKEDSK
jgi:hypothetical protein